MARGVFKGLLAGSFASLCGLTALSVLAPAPTAPLVNTTAPDSAGAPTTPALTASPVPAREEGDALQTLTPFVEAPIAERHVDVLVDTTRAAVEQGDGALPEQPTVVAPLPESAELAPIAEPEPDSVPRIVTGALQTDVDAPSVSEAQTEALNIEQTPPSARPAPGIAAAVVPQISAPDAGDAEVPPGAGSIDETVARIAAGSLDLVPSGSEQPVALQQGVEESAKKPDSPEPVETVNAPGAGVLDALVVSRLEPVLPNPQAAPPRAPEAEQTATIDTETPTPPGSGPVTQETVALTAQAAPEAPEDQLAALETDVGVSDAPLAPQSTDTRPLVLDVTASKTTPQLEADSAPAPTSGNIVEVELADTEEGAAPGVVETTPEASTSQARAPKLGNPQAPEAPATVDVAAAEVPDTRPVAVTVRRTGLNQAARPTIGRPARSLVQVAANDADDDAVPQPEEEVKAEPAVAGALPPLEAHKAAFDNPENRPLMSIVLMDTGQDLNAAPLDLDALGDFPYPLSFAVDTSLPDAKERAARYRARGLEVMALVDFPENLTAADAEVAMSVTLDRVPEAVAILEGPKSGLQGNPQLARQVGDILRDTGHGIVWRPNGLDTAQKLAARNGVASQTLFRDFDSKGQTPVVIRRFLDQAAFKAGQQGGVIMVGRMRAETISALLVWGLQDRVRSVAVAPVSAVLADP